MSSYSYVAVDAEGTESRGTLQVNDSFEAVKRIKEMGLFPTRVLAMRESAPTMRQSRPTRGVAQWGLGRRLRSRVKTPALAVFTRQLATLLEAGMPLVRSLRTLETQAESRNLQWIIRELAQSIESGCSLAEAMQAHPGVFNRLYLNMVKAGEISGALELSLRRLAEFMEKSQTIRRKVTAAMFYPTAVLVVAVGILTLLMTFVVPRFKGVFEGLLEKQGMPDFTMFVFRLSELARQNFWVGLGVLTLGIIAFAFIRRLRAGRFVLDRIKLSLPVVGVLFRKVALARFARTLGTLAGSGVPILQALTIVREATGNAVMAGVVNRVHEQVKQGEPIAPTLKTSGVFPSMVAGMVDVGEQTGALPDMLMKVADICDDEVDTATSALTSLLEPILIVFLAVVVGSIVIAMFLPLIRITEGMGTAPE